MAKINNVDVDAMHTFAAGLPSTLSRCVLHNEPYSVRDASGDLVRGEPRSSLAEPQTIA